MIILIVESNEHSLHLRGLYIMLCMHFKILNSEEEIEELTARHSTEKDEELEDTERKKI